MSDSKIFDGIVERLTVPGRSDGPLSGLTFVAKDNFDVAGHRTGGGVPDWKRTHQPAEETAPAVADLLDAGATLTGKSCMDELAFALDGINMHYGIAANPNLPGHIPGGSSSGSASAVASGLCDFALGTDTAGSVRVPGAFCGVLSMRPTHGRISTKGIVPLGPSFDTVGWFSRDCDSFVKCGEVLLRESAGKSGPSKVRMVSNCLDLLDSKLHQPFLAASRKLGLQISADPVTLPPEALEEWVGLLDVIRSFEAWQFFGNWIEQTNPSMQDVIKKRFLNCARFSESEMLAARSGQSKVIAFLDGLLEDQVLCIPTVFNWPLPCGTSEEELAAHRKNNLRLNIIAGAGGLPQVNIPVPLEGYSCLFGLSLLARRGADAMLLYLARQAVHELQNSTVV